MSASVGRSESMSKDTLLIDGVRVPRFLYGTAWKEDDTARLTELALRAGFRGIDTANQRKHYHEAAVGRGVAAAVPPGAGRPAALRPRRPGRGPGRAVVRQLARAPRDRHPRLLRAARPEPRRRPGAGRLGGVAGDG